MYFKTFSRKHLTPNRMDIIKKSDMLGVYGEKATFNSPLIRV